MKYVNFAFAVVFVLAGLVSAGIILFYGWQGYSMGDDIVLYSRAQWGNVMFLLFVLGCVLVVVWAEGELYHQWDRVSWVVGNLFIIGLIYMVMQEGQIGWFIYEGIVLSIKNLSI
jgi:hypothetical protein